MDTGKFSQFLHQLNDALLPADGGDLSDGQLLEVFLNRRAGAAFEALIRRHGAMVLSACQRVLRNSHDAEDAFQATFLVLIRKAPALRDRQTVANWLYGVAYHTALKARAAGIKRRAKEGQVSAMPKPEARDVDRPDVRALIDRELHCLPARFREPVVLCDLEGKTRKEAAEQLGCPEGTVASRLSRAHAILARRFARRGLAITTTTLAIALSREAASAGAPASLVKPTVQAGLVIAAGEALPAGVSSPIAALVEAVLRGMFLAKLKTAGLATLVAAVVLGGISVPLFYTSDKGTDPRPPALKRPNESVATLDRAIRASGGAAALKRLQTIGWNANVRFPAQQRQAFVVRGTANGWGRWFVYTTLPIQDPKEGNVLMDFRVLLIGDAADTFVGFQRIGPPVPHAVSQFQSMKQLIREGVAAGLMQDLYAIRVAQLLVSLRDEAVELAPLGDATIDNCPATGVSVAAKGRPPCRLFFDKTTGLPNRCAMRVRENDKKPPIVHELLFGNFRDFGGVHTFARVTCKRDGKQWFEIDLVQLSLLENLDESLNAEMKSKYRD